MKRKYYVVWRGRVPGVYDNWADAKAQVDGFVGAAYKGFESPREAHAAYEEGFRGFAPAAPAPAAAPPAAVGTPIADAIAVDAACSGVPGDMEYQGVYVKTGKLLFRQGPYRMGTNNVGEFLAIVHALAYCARNGIGLPIYTDSATALAWIRARQARTKLERTAANQPLFELVDRAEAWIRANTWTNRILKWETAAWGEIPADFGRKGNGKRR